VLFHRDIGDTVVAGDLLATLITRPGMEDGTIEVRAPQSGQILTRASSRFTRVRGDLMKIAGHAPTAATRKPGTLED
jgi:predicted deacylase